MTNQTEDIKFDPGFGPYVLAFSMTKDYLYQEVNKFNNLSQKKVKFMQYYPKILELFYNNIGFYTGCLMWAAYIKTLPENNITGNTCYGGIYSEADNIQDTQELLNFTKQFPKDMKYFLGKNFVFDSEIIKLIEIYEKFLILNKGFTNTKTNTDVVLPEGVSVKNTDEYKKLIEETISEGNLGLLMNHIEKIIRS